MINNQGYLPTGINDVFQAPDFYTSGLIVKRISSDSKSPDILAAPIFDIDQACLLLHVIQEFEKENKLNREYQTMLNQIFQTIEHLKDVLAHSTISTA